MALIKHYKMASILYICINNLLMESTSAKQPVGGWWFDINLIRKDKMGYSCKKKGLFFPAGGVNPKPIRMTFPEQQRVQSAKEQRGEENWASLTYWITVTSSQASRGQLCPPSMTAHHGTSLCSTAAGLSCSQVTKLAKFMCLWWKESDWQLSMVHFCCQNVVGIQVN